MGNFFCKDAKGRQLKLQYTSFNSNKQGTRHLLRKDQEFW